MQGPIGSLCPDCQKKVQTEYKEYQEQEKINAKQQKMKKNKQRGKWYNAARGIRYPITFVFITLIIINYFFLDTIMASLSLSIPQTITPLSIPTDWLFSIALIIIGLIALDKEGPSIFLTIGMLAVVLPFVLGVITVIWFAIQLWMS